MLGKGFRTHPEKIDEPAAVGGTEAAIEKAFLTADGAIEISPVFSENALGDISAAMKGDLSRSAFPDGNAIPEQP